MKKGWRKFWCKSQKKKKLPTVFGKREKENDTGKRALQNDSSPQRQSILLSSYLHNELTPRIIFESYQSAVFILSKSTLNNFYFQLNMEINKRYTLKVPLNIKRRCLPVSVSLFITLDILLLIGINSTLLMASLLGGVAVLTNFFVTWLPKPFLQQTLQAQRGNIFGY